MLTAEIGFLDFFRILTIVRRSGSSCWRSLAGYPVRSLRLSEVTEQGAEGVLSNLLMRSYTRRAVSLLRARFADVTFLQLRHNTQTARTRQSEPVATRPWAAELIDWETYKPVKQSEVSYLTGWTKGWCAIKPSAARFTRKHKSGGQTLEGLTSTNQAKHVTLLQLELIAHSQRIGELLPKS